MRYDQAELLEVSLFDPRYTDDRLNLLAEMRQSGPVAKGMLGPLVVRHAEVATLAADRRLRGPGLTMFAINGMADSTVIDRLRNILLFMDGDDHVRLRRLLSRAFTPKAVEDLRPVARQVIADLVDGVLADGHADAATAICEPYPIPIICALVGVPSDRWREMSGWAGTFLHAIGFNASMHRAEIETAQAEMDAYLLELIAERRDEPRNDLLSRLIAIEEEGERLNEEELLALVFMMLVGGIDTTRNQLGNLIHTFAEHPDQWAIVRERPELIAHAVEEAVRWEPATDVIPRLAHQDIEVAGVEIPAGSVVMLMSQSANHDTVTMPGADRFDVTRDAPSGWHLLTFGGGLHHCLGAALARLELQEALGVLSSRFATLAADGPAVAHPIGSTIAGYTSLPIRWTTSD